MEVSIPHWFDQALRSALNYAKREGVSIPHWFDQAREVNVNAEYLVKFQFHTGSIKPWII